jgi:hypothetical protein
MKKMIRKGLCVLLSMVGFLQGTMGMTGSALAYSDETVTVQAETQDILEWEQFQYLASEEEVTIIGYTETISGALSIPATIGDLPVTRVENNAFSGQNDLTEVEIPATVTEIGSTAFSGCKSLESFVVSEDNPAYCVRNGLILCPVGRKGIVDDIPDTVRLISDSAFADCEELTDVVLPPSVMVIGKLAFFDCISLQSVTLSEQLQKIGDVAFLNCASLKEIYVPENVATISAFSLGYVTNETADGYEPIADFTIRGYYNTTADQYAAENDFVFIGMNREPVATETTTTATDESMVTTTTMATMTTTAAMTTTTAMTTNTAESTMIDDAKMGDVDGDGIASVEDAVLVLTYYAKRAAALSPYLVTETDEEAEQMAFLCADMDGDGTLSIEDAVLILEKYAKQSAGLL